MRKQRKQHRAVQERQATQSQQDALTLSVSPLKEEETQLIVVQFTFTFPNGSKTGWYHIAKIPVSTNLEHYRKEQIESSRSDYPEAQLSVEFLDIDDVPSDGSLPDGMTFRSAHRFEAL